MSQTAIHTHNLTKRYPAGSWRGLLPSRALTPPAVDAVNLTVRQGELFGLLGPNGAGKTTLIKMLCTLVLPTSGEAWVNGHPLHHETAIKAALGLVTTDERSFYWRLTGRQNLAFFAALQNLPPAEIPARIEQVLATVALEDKAGLVFKNYSTGMRQRLSIARALLSRPEILFLDEPAKGLDPPSVKQLHHLIRAELTTRQGITVFLTTHWLEEAEALCDRLAIMHQGRIQACGTMDDLRGLLGLSARYVLRVRGLSPALGADLARYALPASPDGPDFALPNDQEVLNWALDAVRAAGGHIAALSLEKVPLDEMFTRLTDRPLQPPAQSAALPPPAGGEVSGSPPARAAPPREHFWRVARAFLKRDWQATVSYRVSFVLSFFGMFISVAVFYFVAQLFGEAAAPFLAAYGGDYFAFVLIGIAFARYFGVGLSSFASSLRGAQTTGTLEAMLTTPTRLSTIILSSSLWSYAFTTVQVLGYLLVGGLFLGVNLKHGNYPAALVVLALTVLTFSSLGVLSASFIMVLKRGDPINWVINAVSTLLGGVYYPIEVLPDWLQVLSRLLPVSYALRAMRLALLQGAAWGAVLPDVLALLLFSAVLLPASLLAFRFAARQARTDGSLTHY